MIYSERNRSTIFKLHSRFWLVNTLRAYLDALYRWETWNTYLHKWFDCLTDRINFKSPPAGEILDEGKENFRVGRSTPSCDEGQNPSLELYKLNEFMNVKAELKASMDLTTKSSS